MPDSSVMLLPPHPVILTLWKEVTVCSCDLRRKEFGDFPGGSVVKTLHFQLQHYLQQLGHGSNLGVHQQTNG